MKRIFDADILSTFIKTSHIELLSQLFPQDELIIPQKVFDELDQAYHQNKKFTDILKQVDITVEDSTQSKKNLSNVDQRIHSGELDALLLAKKHKTTFLSNDKIALKVATDNGIEVVSLRSLLLTIAQKKIMTKDETIQFLKDIEEKDYTVILDQEEIIDEYEIS